MVVYPGGWWGVHRVVGRGGVPWWVYIGWYIQGGISTMVHREAYTQGERDNSGIHHGREEAYYTQHASFSHTPSMPPSYTPSMPPSLFPEV